MDKEAILGKMMYAEDITNRFNEELQQQIDGTLPKGHVYRLGMPGDILRSAGLPNLPIEMSSLRLIHKSNQENHPFELKEIRNLPEAIQKPMAVFKSATRLGSYVVMTEIRQGNKNFVIAIEANRIQGKIEVNSVRSIHPRTMTNILNWINEGLLNYADKDKLADWVEEKIKTRSYLNSSIPADVRKLLVSTAKIIKDFDNPTISGEKNEKTRFLNITNQYGDIDESVLKSFSDKIKDKLSIIKEMSTEQIYDLLRDVAEFNNAAIKGYRELNDSEYRANLYIYNIKETALPKIIKELYDRDEYVGYDRSGIVYFRDKQGRQISFHTRKTVIDKDFISDFTPIWDGITESWKDENIQFASKKNAKLEQEKNIVGRKTRTELRKKIADTEAEIRKEIDESGKIVKDWIDGDSFFWDDRDRLTRFKDRMYDLLEKEEKIKEEIGGLSSRMYGAEKEKEKKERSLSHSKKTDTIEKLEIEIEKLKADRRGLIEERNRKEEELKTNEEAKRKRWDSQPEVEKYKAIREKQDNVKTLRQEIPVLMSEVTRKINNEYESAVDKEIKNNIQAMERHNEMKQETMEKKLRKTVDLLKKTGFADVKTGEDFYIKLAEVTGDERYWINQRTYSDESRWDNSGYSERNDGSKASVNAISAEEDGTFSAGNFVKKYGVSKTNFEILTALKLIKNTEWHHTGKSFKETEFYSWADSTKADGKVEYDINGQVVNDEDIDFTPLSEIYQEHKKELTKLAKEYTEKNWEYERRKEEKEIPTFEEYTQKIGMENSPLTEEEDKKRRDSHWYISDNLVDELSSYERRIRHEEVDEHYQKIRQERADIYIEANRERLLEEYNVTYKDDMAYNVEIKAYNKGVEESNSLSNGKEKVLLRIAEIFGMNEDKAKLNVKIYSGIKQAAIRHKAREEWVESQEKELNKTIVKKDNELQAWLQKQVKEGKVKYQNRITRQPDNFIETKKEKYGKYGWYDASKTIGGQEYYSGYEFESEKLYKEYRRRFRAIIDIKVKTKDKILEEANVRFLVERNVQGLGSLQSSIGENAIFGTKTTLSQKIIPQIKEKVERKINDDDGIRFMIGKQMRTMYEAGIRKKNHNITEKDIKTSLDFLHSLENNKENAKAIKVAVKWLTDDTIRLPYAIDNVRKAIAVAEKNKIDPTQYSSPMDIINEFYKDVEYGEHIAPDTVEAFKNKRTVGRGKNEVTIYDIDDNRAGQEAVCKICHEHFGYSVENKDSKQPWCLASFTRQGKPTESAIKYWDKTYNSVGKKIAFKDGKPIAFMAHDREHNYDLWWNLKDDPSDNLPLPNGRYISPDGEIELRKYGEGENELFDEAVEYVADELSDYDVEKILGDLKEKIDDGVEDIEVSYLFYEAEERAVRRARNSFIETTRYAIDSGDYDKYLKGRIDEYKKKKHIGEDGKIDEDDLKDLKDELAEDIADNFEDYEGAEGIWDDIFREKYEEELYNEDYSLSQKVAMIEDHIRQYPMGSVSDDVQDKKIELRGDDLESDGLGDNYRYSRPNGTVLGFVKGNTIYLNPDEVSLNTPIHEFGHLWVSQVKKYFPDLWQKGKELFLQSDYLKVVQEDSNYSHLDLDGQVDEAMARAIGDNGEKELNKTLFEKISNWISNVWKHIGSKFGIENLTSKQIQNLSLQDFTNIATSELLSGRNLTKRVNKQKEIETTTERYQINTEEKKEKPNKVECSIKCEIGDKLTKNYYNNRVLGSSEKLSAVDIFTFLQQTKEKGRTFFNDIVSEATGNRLDGVRLTAKNVVERIINPMTEKQQFAVKEAMVQYVAQQKEVINSAVRISR